MREIYLDKIAAEVEQHGGFIAKRNYAAGPFGFAEFVE
jgi:hypothetical protein